METSDDRIRSAPGRSGFEDSALAPGPYRLSDLQREVDRWVLRFPEGYWPPLANLARLTEETGELARAVNQRVGAKRLKRGEASGDVPLEMGDVLFTLCVLANQCSVDLDKAIALTLEKVRTRDLGPT